MEAEMFRLEAVEAWLRDMPEEAKPCAAGKPPNLGCACPLEVYAWQAYRVDIRVLKAWYYEKGAVTFSHALPRWAQQFIDLVDASGNLEWRNMTAALLLSKLEVVKNANRTSE